MAVFKRIPALWWPLLVGSALRLLGLDRLSYWLDEIASLVLSRPALGVIFAANNEQIHHPPLYFALLHYWIIPGDGETWTRLLSALIGIGTIPVVYALGCVLFSRQVGGIAAWLLALSPWHIWYSQETRMYILVCLWATLALLLAVRWVHAPRWPLGLAYVAVTALGLYTDYTMFELWPLLVLLLPLWRRARWSRALLRRWLALNALAALAYGPQLRYLPGFVKGLYTSDLLGANVGTPAANLPRIVAALVVVGGLLIVAWVGLRRVPPARLRQILAGGLLLALAGSLLMMLNPSATLLKRLFSILIPLLCLGQAWAMTQMRLAALRFRYWALASALAVALMFALVPKEPWRDVVADLDRQAQPGDLVMIEPAYNTLALAYYDRNNLPRQGVDPQGLTPAFAQQVAAAQRVWLVLAYDARLDPQGQVRSWFAARYQPRTTQDYYRITVQRYDLPTP